MCETAQVWTTFKWLETGKQENKHQHWSIWFRWNKKTLPPIGLIPKRSITVFTVSIFSVGTWGCGGVYLYALSRAAWRLLFFSCSSSVSDCSLVISFSWRSTNPFSFLMLSLCCFSTSSFPSRICAKDVQVKHLDQEQSKITLVTHLSIKSFVE